MPILGLPLEALFLIIENLDIQDLWALYNSCRAFRTCSARFIFQVVEVRFDGVYPMLLNSRSFPPGPNRLLPMLRQWSSHIRKIDLWGDEDSIQPEFLNILGTMDNLKAFSISYPPNLYGFQKLLTRLASLPSLETLDVDFMSPRTWTLPMTFGYLRTLHLSCIEHEPGLCSLPSLPTLETLVLNFCCYCLECPRNGEGPWTLVHFSRLPRLLSLSITGAQDGSIICCGRATQLRRLKITYSSGLDLGAILAGIGTDLEAVHILDCEFVTEEPTPRTAYPVLKQLTILDAVSGLSPFHLAKLPSLEELSVRIHPSDFEQLEDWPLILSFLRCVPVTLRLNSPGPPEIRKDQTCRLWQIASLPNAQLQGHGWLWQTVCGQGERIAEGQGRGFD